MKHLSTTLNTVAILLCSLVFCQFVYAAPTTSAIRGNVLDANNDPVSGVVITVEDLRTGVVRAYTSNSSGAFFAPKLTVGGPYKVSAPDMEAVTIDYVGVGDIYKVTLKPAEEEDLDEVVVVGQAQDLTELALGPVSMFSAEDLDESTAFDRDIKDVYSIDPRLSIDDPTNGSALNCAGRHPRFNSVTLDGVSYNDRFGLNSNGYSTATGMPFPYEAVENVAVEFAPFNVSYGGFSACNINAVTKSGSNEWHGSLFYEYSSDSLRGDTIVIDGEDVDVPSEAYTEDKFGFSIGGPLIENKLFAFAAYEKSEKPLFIGVGYDGSGVGEERPWLSEADYNRINDIATDIYNYDTGGQPGNGALSDEKYMFRLDWQINDMHTATAVYNYYEGSEDRASDSDSYEFEFANHFYVKGAELTTYTFKLASQWTDALSTEFYYSYNEMIDSQVTVGNKDFAEMQIGIDDREGLVYLGADDSRQANQLDTESNYLKLSAQYLVGDHIISAGFEREELSIFNLFVQHARGGEYHFNDDSDENPDSCAALTAQERLDDANCALSGIDKFELGLPDTIIYNSGGGTNDPTDAAASFSNTLNTLYIQDEYYIAEYALTLVGGLRYDFFTSDDRPNYNPTFTAANNGLRNDANIDGLDIWMPRFGFNWEASNNLSVRGGLGVFSGGNPNVWISNAWSKDGITNVEREEEDLEESIFDLQLSGDGRPGYDVPQSLVDEILAVTPEEASYSKVVILDPEYDQPSELKLSLGMTYEYDNGLTVDIDLLSSRLRDSAYYVDLSQEVIGETTLGTPIYDYVDVDINGQDNLMLTNSYEVAKSHTLSIALDKDFDNGFSATFGYAATKAEDISPMTSSTADSNFNNTALIDINNPLPGTSNYEVPQRFTLKLSYYKEFFSGLGTRFGLFGYHEQGQGQSYVMGSSDLEGYGRYGRHLLYVPTGLDDSNVIFGEDFDSEAFFAWADENGLTAGSFVQRNGANADWTTRFDLRVDQDLPTFFEGAEAKVYFKLYNLGNFLNDEWGLVTDAQFFSQQVVDSTVNESGQFVYEEFNDRDVNNVIEAFSVWQARLGIEISF